MTARTKIFTVYENPECGDPSDRAVLVREGFSLCAFLFHGLWLLYHRLWIPALVFLGVLGVLGYAAEAFAMSTLTAAALQLFLQVMLGFSAYDVQRWNLTRRGYRFTAVIAAETSLDAVRRYYDAVA